MQVPPEQSEELPLMEPQPEPQAQHILQALSVIKRLRQFNRQICLRHYLLDQSTHLRTIYPPCQPDQLQLFNLAEMALPGKMLQERLVQPIPSRKAVILSTSLTLCGSVQHSITRSL